MPNYNHSLPLCMAGRQGSPSQVHIQRAPSESELKKATLATLDTTNFNELAESAQRIVIKPNLVTKESAQAGITADPALTEAILERLNELGKRPDQLKIAEGTAGSKTTPQVFALNGYEDLAARFDVDLVDCNTAETVKLEVPNHLSAKRLRVSKVVYDADLRISVAKLKIHSVGKVTGVMKNMMGVAPGKWKLVVHANVHKRVVDLNQLVLPHYGLIDGFIGNQVDEVVSFPRQAGIVLGSKDMVALDTIAALCIGVVPTDVGYLKHSQANGFGNLDPGKIEVTGADLDEVVQRFETAKGLPTLFRVNYQKACGRLVGLFGAR